MLKYHLAVICQKKRPSIPFYRCFMHCENHPSKQTSNLGYVKTIPHIFNKSHSVLYLLIQIYFLAFFSRLIFNGLRVTNSNNVGDFVRKFLFNRFSSISTGIQCLFVFAISAMLSAWNDTYKLYT